MFDGTLDNSGFRRKMEKLISNVRNPQKMKIVAGMMFDAVETNFEKQGRPRWKRLKASTLGQRRRQNKTGKILQVGGKLAASITQKFTATTATVGTNLKYAAIHQKGGTIHHPGGTPYKLIGPGRAVFLKKGTPGAIGITKPHDIDIPARPFMKFTPGDLTKMKRQLGVELIKGVR